MSWWHGPGIVEDVTTLVRSPSGTLDLFPSQAALTRNPTYETHLPTISVGPCLPTEECIPTSLSPLSTNDQRRFDLAGTVLPFHSRGHASTLPSATLSSVPTSPHTLHPTLSSWLKNINKLSALIDRLQQLASSAPEKYRTQLSRQVATLRATFKKQQERCIDFLRLSEEYADKYLLDISAEIRQQSSLDMLEKRLDMAETLRQQAVELRRSYESGTVSTMSDVRTTALSQPLPEDFDLFSEVDFVLCQVLQCYVEMDKFWREEICHAAKALERRRVDPSDVERWKNFHASLKETIDSWKSRPPSGSSETICRNDPRASTGANIGEIASSLSSAMGSLEEALKLIHSSASLEYTSYSGLSLVLRVQFAFTRNSDLCLAFLRRCVDYQDFLAALYNSPNTWHAPCRVVAPHDLCGRAMRPAFETTSGSTENADGVEGSRKFRAAYKQALSLEQKTILELNTLLGNLASWVVATDALRDESPPTIVTLRQLRELSHAWAIARDSVRAALVSLTSEPTQRLYYRSASLTVLRPRSAMKRWMTNLVCLS